MLRPARSRGEEAPDSHRVTSEGRVRSGRWARAGLEGHEGHMKRFKSTVLTGEGQWGLQIVSDQMGDQSGHSCRGLRSDDGAMD